MAEVEFAMTFMNTDEALADTLDKSQIRCSLISSKVKQQQVHNWRHAGAVMPDVCSII